MFQRAFKAFITEVLAVSYRVGIVQKPHEEWVLGSVMAKMWSTWFMSVPSGSNGFSGF